ncbi:MAG: undecaprenyl-diphosphate phosphatase [Pirellulales bacterium]
MSLLEILILAIVQGVTEFLPISSSGHLVVADSVLGSLGYGSAPDLLTVNIVLHLGTLLSILVYYWREILRLVGADRRVIPLLIVGTLPAVIVGLPLKKYGEAMLESPLLSGCMFPVTAAILIWASLRPEGTLPYTAISYPKALTIGLFQAFAILPGVSRSGSTIAGGLGTGLDRRSAGTFAFLLAIPAIAGAGTLELIDLLTEPATTAVNLNPIHLLLGAGTACLVGLGALSLLIRWVQQGRLAIFAWYLVPLGIAVVVWQLSQ